MYEQYRHKLLKRSRSSLKPKNIKHKSVDKGQSPAGTAAAPEAQAENGCACYLCTFVYLVHKFMQLLEP